MAILKIARLGHPVLLRRADPVGNPGAADVRRLAADMVETMLDAGGVGLAAPQVHVPARLIVLHVPPTRDAVAIPVTVLVDPELELLPGPPILGWEGCLSIPGLRGEVPRQDAVHFRARGLDGAPIEGVARGLHARILQHEVDHLDGILYPMRMPDLGRLAFEEEAQRYQLPREQ